MADYNKTLNLPKTDFPMRAGLPKREPGNAGKLEKDRSFISELLEKERGQAPLRSARRPSLFQRRDCIWATP